MNIQEYQAKVKLKVWVNNLSPEELVKCAKQCIGLLEYLDPEKQTEEIQLNAVTLNGEAIRYIENPSEAMQLVAVKQDRCAIQYIKTQDRCAIRYIKNPSEAVQLVAVKQNGLNIQYIENPTEDVQLVAAKQWWKCW